MKKQILTLCLVALAVVMVFAACQKEAAPSQVSSTAAGEGSVKGTVVDATMNTVTIQAPNGSEYTFGTENAEISSPEGLLIGDEVTVHYTGTFDDSKQVQDVQVTSIFVDAEAGGGDGNVGAGSQPASPATQDVQSLTGTIEQYDGGDTMMVVDATGVDFLFSLEGADLHVGQEGFKVGDEVIVYYYGELYDKPEVQDVQAGEVKKANQ